MPGRGRVGLKTGDNSNKTNQDGDKRNSNRGSAGKKGVEAVSLEQLNFERVSVFSTSAPDAVWLSSLIESSA